MSLMETVAQKTFDVVLRNASVAVTVDGHAAKVACAFPRGADPADYGPWSDEVVRQVYFEQDPVTTAAIEIDFSIAYRVSAARQYVDEVFVDTVTRVPVPYSLDAKVEFRDVITDESSGLEVATIPFVISVTRSHPIFGVSGGLARGVVRGDAATTLNTFDMITA